MRLTARITATFNRSGAVDVPAVPGSSKGTGAPAAKLLGLLAISLVALLASAAPASAAPSATMSAITEVSYASAHVEGTVNGGGAFSTNYRFEYCSDEHDCSENVNWISAGDRFDLPFFLAVDKPVKDELKGLRGGTKYFVRLKAYSITEEAFSSPPNPDFTTLPVDPPTITATDDASEVFSLSAKATGKVKRPSNPDSAFNVTAFYSSIPDPAFTGTACRFEYVTDADFIATGFQGATPVPCEQPTIAEPNAEPSVSAQLTGLEPETTYHLRLAAENAAPGVATKDALNTFTTAAKVAAPSVVSIDDASEIAYNSAKLSGKVLRPAGTDPALDVDCRFEYITDAQFIANEGNSEPGFTGAQSADCVQNPVQSAGETTVSAKAGLLPKTTYHFRLIAENAGGTDSMVASNTFTTPEAEKPIVTIEPVAGGTFTTAHVSGTLQVSGPSDRIVRPFFQISTDGGTSWATFEAPSDTIEGIGGGTFNIQHDYTDLQPSTVYTFRIGGTYSLFPVSEAEALGEVAFSLEETITTEPLFPPTAENLDVTDVTANSAHFSATVNPNAPAGPLNIAGKKAFATHWTLECVPECKNANGNPISGTVEGEEGAQTIGADARRLDPNTEYQVSLVISSEGGGETLGPVSFSTPLIKPTIKVIPGGSDGKGGYTLQGVINPNGSEVTDCKFEWGPNAPAYAFSADCSPPLGAGAKPVTVEAHLAGLTPGAVYHFNLLATNGAGKEESGDQQFTPTLASAETCSNEQIRKENSSIALPECRAYEMVTSPNKEGFGAKLAGYDGDNRVHYESGAGNIVKSGQHANTNHYVTIRSTTGWETIPNLNGSSGVIYDTPSEMELTGFISAVLPEAYSSDLLSSMWVAHRRDGLAGRNLYLRNSAGRFTLVGSAKGGGSDGLGGHLTAAAKPSSDLSHIITGAGNAAGSGANPSEWGPGVYEFVGTGVDQPRRVDVENTGAPVAACTGPSIGWLSGSHAFTNALSDDGRVVFFTVFGGCGGPNPPTDEIWARVNGTTSFDVSSSQCNRDAGDPGGVCNGPVGKGSCAHNEVGKEVGPGCRGIRFEGAANDGSRVFFTTSQQLVDADADQSRDIYACDIPSGAPVPAAAKANPCAAFRQVSAAPNGAAEVGGVLAMSDSGSTVLFTAKGVLADNKDSLGEQAVDGDLNLYVWRTDAAHPAGQNSFVGRLEGSGVDAAQVTPDGRYLVFTTDTQLLDTDTDSAADVYRYDADSGELTRASTNVFGVAGNGEAFDAQISDEIEHHSTVAISNGGQKIVFITSEELSPADGNDEPDVYLWTPAGVSLVSAGSVGGGVVLGGSPAVITGSGQDIYFQTRGALTPADGDGSEDIYDARVGGGFSFAKANPCSGEACQSSAPESPGTPAPASANPPLDPGNVKPKTCPKGKVPKRNRCVKKKRREHAGKHGKKHAGKKSAHKRRDGK